MIRTAASALAVVLLASVASAAPAVAGDLGSPGPKHPPQCRGFIYDPACDAPKVKPAPTRHLKPGAVHHWHRFTR